MRGTKHLTELSDAQIEGHADWSPIFNLMELSNEPKFEPNTLKCIAPVNGPFAGDMLDISKDDVFKDECGDLLEAIVASIMAYVCRSASGKVREAMEESEDHAVSELDEPPNLTELQFSNRVNELPVSKITTFPVDLMEKFAATLKLRD
jgi:hypothetical protein